MEICLVKKRRLRRSTFHRSDCGRCHRPMQAAARPGIVSNVIASTRVPYLDGENFQRMSIPWMLKVISLKFVLCFMTK